MRTSMKHPSSNHSQKTIVFLPILIQLYFHQICITNKCKMKNINLQQTQQTFQRCFNVVFWLIRCRDVGQRKTNVEIALCISTLEFTTSNNVESMLCISTLIWTTLDNIETTLSFSTLIWTTLVNVETTLWKWPFLKRAKQIISNRIHEIRSFCCYFIIFFTLLPMLSWIRRRVLARPQKFFKYYERFSIART